MTSLFFLLLVSAFITVILLVFSVIFLIKRKKKTGQVFLALFVVFIGLSVLLAYQYVNKTIEFVKSDEFQDNVKNSAAFIGKTSGSILSGTAEGLSEGLDDNAIKKMASKTTVITGK